MACSTSAPAGPCGASSPAFRPRPPRHRVEALGQWRPLTPAAALPDLLQRRTFLGLPWGRQTPLDTSEGVPPPTLGDEELAAVDTVLSVSAPGAMDTIAWTHIHAGTWYHTYIAELLLQGVHDSLSMSWLGVIPLTVVLMRTMMAPAMIEQQRAMFATNKAKPKVEKAQADMMMAMETGGNVADAQAKYLADVNRVMAEHKVSPLAMLYPMLVTVPVFTGFYFALTGMCAGQLPSLVFDGVNAGLYDLTRPDPRHIGPVAVSATMLLQVYLSFSHQWETLPENMKVAARYGAFIAPPALAAAMWAMPGALCYYWTCSNIYSVAFDFTLRIPSFRKAVGLPSRQEMIDVALEAQRTQQTGGPMGRIFDMYKTGAHATAQGTDGKDTGAAPAAAASGLAKVATAAPAPVHTVAVARSRPGSRRR